MTRKPLGFIGLLILLGMITMALTAQVAAPYNPVEIHKDATFVSPGLRFLMGTDALGRDQFSRILYGARISLYVGVFSVLFGTSMGALIGLTSAYFNGKYDLVVQRVMDSLMAFPLLILALVVVAALGASLNNVVLAISVVITPGASRIIRSAALSVKERQFIDAAKAIGATRTRVLFRHLLPNCAAPYIIMATAQLGNAILTEASLSFLGVGVPPPEPTWGGMLSGSSQQYIETAPWLAIFPGLAISMAVFGVNLLGDALRDVWDPRLRGR